MTTQARNDWRAITCAATLLLITAATVSHFAQAAGGKKNPGVMPPNSKFRGLGYERLEAHFWQALFSIPVVDGDHPLFSGGPVAGPKGIVFLPAPFGGAEIEVTIPTGTALFIPIVNAECSAIEPDPFHGDDEAEQRECANNWMDHAYGLEASIDGVPVNNVEDYRFESPQFVIGPLPADNAFAFFGVDAPAGTTTTSVDAGFYLLLNPLSVGEHTVHFSGFLDPLTPEDTGDDILIDTTFLITVAPKNR